MDKMQDDASLVEKVLDSLDREQLCGFIRAECRHDDAFRDRFLALGAGKVYAPNAGIYSARIEDAIETHTGRYGYVEYRGSFELNSDLSLILDEAQRAIANGNWSVALAVLAGMSDSAETILECGDDSAGELGAIVDECFEMWMQLVSQKLPDDVADAAYGYAMRKFGEKCLEGFDWWWDWLRLAAKVAATDEKRSAVFAELDKFEKPKDDNDWMVKWDYDKARTLRMQLMADCCSKEELRKYLYDNIDNDDVRRKLLQTTWDEGDLDECLRVAIDSENQEGGSGCAPMWRQWQLRVYMKQGDTSNILRLARYFFVEGMYRRVYDSSIDCSMEAMYSLMKAKVPKAEWAGWVEAIAAEPKISSTALLYLYKKEKMWDRYMQYLSKHAATWALDDAPAQLRKLYKDEFVRLYAKCVTEHFSHASDRKGCREGAQKTYRIRRQGRGVGHSRAAEVAHTTPTRPHRRTFKVRPVGHPL